ncbi:MAG: HAD hydrolase-like protein [Clostridiales bacterium]|nr:HAD hydrolase-like protein [Clostridiales bacterium]
MMKKYKYILWDLDGTIINSYEGVSKCVQYALEYYGIRPEGEENLRRFIGPPLRESFPKYAGLPQEHVEAAVARYRGRYDPIGVFECELFPGVREAMESLREAGFVQVLSSSKPELRCRDILKKFHLTGYLDEVVGASMDGRIDTKIQVLNETFRRLGPSFRKEEAVLIGDTKYDADGAAQAGIDCIGVSYGFGTREELLEHGVMAVYDDLSVLVSDLKSRDRMM